MGARDSDLKELSGGDDDYQPPPPPPTPTKYDAGTTIDPGHGSVTDRDPFKPPAIPGGHGKGKKTSVDTPSMDLFAANILQLVDPVRKASDALGSLPPLAPGAFYHANKIRQSINGANADGGLREQYQKVLYDLTNALTDLGGGVKRMAEKYKTLSDAADMTAKDLLKAMDGVAQDFDLMMKDGGGAGGLSGAGGGGADHSDGGSDTSDSDGSAKSDSDKK